MTIMSSRTVSLALFLLCQSQLLFSKEVSSFVLTPQVTSKTNLYGSKRITLRSSFKDELENLDRARAVFEDLFMRQAQEPSKTSPRSYFPLSKEDYVPPPLTESSRRRRRVEMDLISSLEDSDEAIDELMSLWLVERGIEGAMKCKDMEILCSPGLAVEERALRGLIEQYGSDWAEPMSRLAALLFFRGETKESEYWCHVALAVKPWHFEAVQTLVLNALRREDIASALYWKRKGLPNLNEANQHKKRKEWVKHAVKLAQESLNKAEAAAEERQCDDAFENIPAGEAWQ